MNITKKTKKFIQEHPSIKDNLASGLINYSKLSRKIISSTKLTEEDFDAILVALRRQEIKLSKKKSFELDIKKILKETKLEVKNKIMVCILEKNVYSPHLIEFQKEIKTQKEEMQLIEGVGAITLIINQEFEKEINKLFKHRIIKKTKDLIKIVLRSPDTLEAVPGYMGHLYSLFSDKGINIVETMSCWTDTIIVIERKNLEKTMNLLSF